MPEQQSARHPLQRETYGLTVADERRGWGKQAINRRQGEKVYWRHSHCLDLGLDESAGRIGDMREGPQPERPVNHRRKGGIFRAASQPEFDTPGGGEQRLTRL